MKIYDRLLIVLAVFITMTPLSQADGFNPSVWEKPSQNQLRQTLNELQYYVTQQEGTEKPFHNAYWENDAEGIYAVSYTHLTLPTTSRV